MSGAILMLKKMPENCTECPCGSYISNPIEICIMCKVSSGCVIDDETKQRPDWCPLIEASQKNNGVRYEDALNYCGIPTTTWEAEGQMNLFDFQEVLP